MVVWSGFEEARRQQPMTWTAVKPDILCREAVQRAIACIRLCALYLRVGELSKDSSPTIGPDAGDRFSAGPSFLFLHGGARVSMVGWQFRNTPAIFPIANPSPAPAAWGSLLGLQTRLRQCLFRVSQTWYIPLRSPSFLKLKRAHIATVRTSELIREVRNWTFVRSWP